MGKNSLSPAYGGSISDATLGDIGDVDTTGVQDNWQLYWDASQQLWITKARDGGFRGTYADPTALQTAVPNGVPGDWAEVISTGTVWIWTAGAWTDSGTPTMGDMSKAVYDPQNINGDAFARANMTGVQAISTITGLQAVLDSKVVSVTAGDATITIGGTAQNPTISLEASLASAIGSALQPGDNVSQLVNDANYVPTGANVSVFVNDANYASSGDNISVFVNDAGYVDAAGAASAAPIQSITASDPTISVAGTASDPTISVAGTVITQINTNTNDIATNASDIVVLDVAVASIGTWVTVGALGQYMILPGGGIVQKGTIDVASGGTTITFPIAFTDITTLRVVGSYREAQSGNQGNRMVGFGGHAVGSVTGYVHQVDTHGVFGADVGAQNSSGEIDWYAMGE